MKASAYAYADDRGGKWKICGIGFTLRSMERVRDLAVNKALQNRETLQIAIFPISREFAEAWLDS